MKALLPLSIVLLIGCAVSPLFVLWGSMSMGQYKTALAGLSVAYFVVATIYATRGKASR